MHLNRLLKNSERCRGEEFCFCSRSDEGAYPLMRNLKPKWTKKKARMSAARDICGTRAQGMCERCGPATGSFASRGAAEVDETPLPGRDDSLSPVDHLEFAEDILDMDLHRVFSDIQGGADFLVPQAPGDALQDLQLARAQPHARLVFGQPCR